MTENAYYILNIFFQFFFKEYIYIFFYIRKGGLHSRQSCEIFGFENPSLRRLLKKCLMTCISGCYQCELEFVALAVKYQTQAAI